MSKDLTAFCLLQIDEFNFASKKLNDSDLFWLLVGGHYGLGCSATWKSLGTSYYSQSRRLDSAAYDLTRFPTETCSGF